MQMHGRFEGFSLNSALFGLVSYNDPCKKESLKHSQQPHISLEGFCSKDTRVVSVKSLDAPSGCGRYGKSDRLEDWWELVKLQNTTNWKVSLFVWKLVEKKREGILKLLIFHEVEGAYGTRE